MSQEVRWQGNAMTLVSTRLHKRVLVVQRRLTHYRMPFFESLRTHMASRGMELVVARGASAVAEAGKRDGGELDWAIPLHTTYFFGGKVCLQPLGHLSRVSDLVVLTHENKLVCNLATQYLSRKNRVALWGHGANLQVDAPGWKDHIKRLTARQADWWFGYTEMSRPLIQASGFPSDRITVLNNAVDTVEMARQFASVTEEARAALRGELGVLGKHVGVFIGSLYGTKRIGFLLDAALAIRERVPEFELLIAGAGPDLNMVEAFRGKNAWVRYVGPRTGQHKANLLALAHVMLNPGGVGLGILDSFVCQVPMVTTDCRLHGPEIAYLEDGVNGLMTENDLSSYVNAVVGILEDKGYRNALASSCSASASKYTIDNMARSFCNGAEACLQSKVHRSWM